MRRVKLYIATPIASRQLFEQFPGATLGAQANICRFTFRFDIPFAGVIPACRFCSTARPPTH